jgi:truncated hemoglobin YjbI
MINKSIRKDKNMSKNLTKEEFDQWLQLARPGEKVVYHTGFYVRESDKQLSMRRFSAYLIDLASSLKTIFLYQKKVKDMEYEYYAEKR